jgi:hypothetical protein
VNRLLKRSLQLLGVLILLGLTAGLVAPFLHADGYGSAIRAALERSLDRRVELGRVHFNLFTGPGFAVDDVVIHERPEFGIEPIAYVGQMDARVRLLSLWTGHLEFSTLRLADASLNLTRREGRGWNVQALLAPAIAGRDRQPNPPTLLVRGGRLNFKFENTKSIFYLSNADLDASPTAHGLELWFSGEPARTDRSARGFGRFKAKGQIDVLSGKEGAVDLTLELVRANLDDLSQLTRGQGLGLQGLISSRTRLNGPVSNIRIEGDATVEDVRRWDATAAPPRSEAWKLPLTGRADLLAGMLDVAAGGGPAAPLSGRLHLEGLLSRFQWTWSAILNAVPLDPVADLARNVGTPLPPGFKAAGTATGTFEFSSSDSPRGTVQLNDVSLSAPDALGPLRLESATVTLTGAEYQLEPTPVTLAPGETAMVHAGYDATAGVLRMGVSGRGVPLKPLTEAAERLLGAGPVPVLSEFQSGAVSGRVEYLRQGDAPEWSGEFQISNGSLAIAGLAAPLRAVSGNVSLAASRVVVKALSLRAGTLDLRGDYRYEPAAARPHQFNLSAARLDASELERLLLPALRRRQGFFARTLRLAGARAPDWLALRHAEGTFRAAEFTIGPASVRDFHARVLWEGARISSTNVAFSLEEGSGSGYFIVNLRDSGPDFRVGSRLRNLAWNGGHVDLEGVITTAGIGPDVLANLKAEGTFEARDVPSPADNQIREASGAYQVSMLKGTPVVQLSGVEARVGDDVYKGQGSTLADGRLQLELRSGERQVKLAGAWSPFNLEAIATP